MHSNLNCKSIHVHVSIINHVIRACVNVVIGLVALADQLVTILLADRRAQ